MKLWLIKQDFNSGWDTYDSAVVAAETEDDARRIHPSGNDGDRMGTWCDPEHVSARAIGDATTGTSRGVILASFNAG